jgi:ABC-type sugar transport system substrate-binding protein
MKLNVFSAAALLAVGAIAAGCGSSDNSDSTASTAAISKTAYVTQANQICKQGNAEVDQAGKKLGNNVTEAQVEDFVASTVVPNIQRQVNDVKALGAPPARRRRSTS